MANIGGWVLAIIVGVNGMILTWCGIGLLIDSYMSSSYEVTCRAKCFPAVVTTFTNDGQCACADGSVK